MTPLFFLIYLFTIIYGGDSVDVSISTDIDEDCEGTNVNGCLRDEGIIVSNPFIYTKHGCTVLENEFHHWLGFKENNMPYCYESQEFRK